MAILRGVGTTGKVEISAEPYGPWGSGEWRWVAKRNGQVSGRGGQIFPSVDAALKAGEAFMEKWDADHYGEV